MIFVHSLQVIRWLFRCTYFSLSCCSDLGVGGWVSGNLNIVRIFKIRTQKWTVPKVHYLQGTWKCFALNNEWMSTVFTHAVLDVAVRLNYPNPTIRFKFYGTVLTWNYDFILILNIPILRNVYFIQAKQFNFIHLSLPNFFFYPFNGKLHHHPRICIVPFICITISTHALINAQLSFGNVIENFEEFSSVGKLGMSSITFWYCMSTLCTY